MFIDCILSRSECQLKFVNFVSKHGFFTVGTLEIYLCGADQSIKTRVSSAQSRSQIKRLHVCLSDTFTVWKFVTAVNRPEILTLSKRLSRVQIDWHPKLPACNPNNLVERVHYFNSMHVCECEQTAQNTASIRSYHKTRKKSRYNFSSSSISRIGQKLNSNFIRSKCKVTESCDCINAPRSFSAQPFWASHFTRCMCARLTFFFLAQCSVWVARCFPSAFLYSVCRASCKYKKEASAALSHNSIPSPDTLIPRVSREK